MLRVSATANTSNKVSLSTSPGLLTAQQPFSLVGIFRINATTGAYNLLCGRGATNASVALRNWAICCDSGSGVGGNSNRLRFSWNRGSTDEALNTNSGNSDANGAMVNGRINHIAFTFNGTDSIKCYLNGTLCFDAVVTGTPNDNAYAFTWGADPGSASTGGPLDIAEWEVTSEVLTQAQVTALVNDWNPAAATGSLKRIRDLGLTPANYWDMLGNETTTITDKAGSLNGTGSGVTLPLSTYLDHPPMAEPIAVFDAASGVYDATSGGSACTDGVAVARWEDSSGRKLHLTESTEADRPVYRAASGDPFPGIFFNKFPSTSSPDTASVAKLSISGVRFNTASMTVAAVFDTVSVANEYYESNVNADRTFKTLWCNDNAAGGRVLLSREVASGVAGGVWSSGVVRSEGVNLDSGGGQSTPSAYAFVPCTPTLLVYCSDSTKTQKQGVAINDFSAANIRTSTTALAAVGTAGSFHLGYNPNASGGLANHGHWGAFYKLTIWNRPVATLGASAGSLTPGATLEALRDAYDTAGLITKNPRALVLVDGSSSAEGLAASDGRNLSYRLWANDRTYRRSWIMNIGSRVAKVTADVTGGTVNVPSRDNHATDTWDIWAARFATVPRHTFFWGGLNDINGSTGSDSGSTSTAEDLLTAVETYLTNRQTAQGEHLLGSALWPLSVVFELWESDITDGDEGDRIAEYNGLLDTSESRGVLYNRIVRISETALADINAAAADDYTGDNRHPNPAGFALLFDRVKRDALYTPGARRSRARCLMRTTSPLDYAQR